MNRPNKQSIPILAFLLLLASGNTLGAEGFSVLSEDSVVTVQYDGKLVTRYVLDQANKPYLWPVIGPTGKRMTRSHPMEDIAGEKKDHPHHRSIWFGHHSIGGFDTWSEAASNRNTGAKRKAWDARLGSTVHTAFTEISANPQRAVIRSNNDYLSSSGEKLMADQRSMIFSKPDGKLVIDFDIKLMATYGDIELKDVKDAGFSVRIPVSMSVEFGEGHIINSEGVRDPDTWSKRARWVDYHGPVEGDYLGIAMLNHPSSFRHPPRWHVRDYGLLTVNPFGEQVFDKSAASATFTLKKGESIPLRNRVIFHKGDVKAAGIAKAYAEYSKQE